MPVFGPTADINGTIFIASYSVKICVVGFDKHIERFSCQIIGVNTGFFDGVTDQ